MECMDVLKELTVHAAVSGHEKHLADYIKGIFEKYCDEVEVDRFYNVIGIKRGLQNPGKRIMLSAHMDEIGFLVNKIDDRGFIKFSKVGGIDSKILLAHEVIIHGKKDISGVIGAKPPHLLKAEEQKKSVKMEELSIDTGMDAQTLKGFVSIGDLITLKASPWALQGSKISSKSIDNRCGVAVLIETMKILQNIKNVTDVCFIATVQEEIELTGAIVSAYNVKPDVAIVVDACHGDMPDCPKDEIFILGKGPAIGIGPILHKNLYKKLVELAKEDNIPYQIDVEPGDTGTEALATQVSRHGIPTALVSIPVRYMHTAVETVQINDIRNSAKLLAKFIMSFDDEILKF